MIWISYWTPLNIDYEEFEDAKGVIRICKRTEGHTSHVSVKINIHTPDRQNNTRESCDSPPPPKKRGKKKTMHNQDRQYKSTAVKKYNKIKKCRIYKPRAWIRRV